MARPADKSTALWVLRRLRKAGHQALLAGGCVRDMLLGQRSSDYDIATDASPQQVKRLFGRVLLIGAKFGVAMVLHRGRKVEVTTFRSDLSYSDGRRPDGVTFASPREDALRRDFTINGMFYDPLAEKIIDYVGGKRDLRRGVIRTIGRPAQRFAEDYLRMIRAVRFAVRLGFRIEAETARAVRAHAPKITSISGERIFEELSKMLSLPSAGEALRSLDALALAKPILPELFASDLCAGSVLRVEALGRRKDLTLTLAALLVDLPPTAISRIIRRWGAANDLRDALCWMSRHLNDWRQAGVDPADGIGQQGMPLHQFKRLLASEHFQRLRALWSFQERALTGGRTCSRRIARRAASIRKDQIAPPPLLTGDDLLAMGVREGPQLGRVLRAIYDAQLNEHIRSRAAALKAAKQMIGR